MGGVYMSTNYEELILNNKHRIFARYMYDKQSYTPVCDIIFGDRVYNGTDYYPSFAYGLFYDLTPKPFNRALDIFRWYAYKYDTFCKYKNRELFTFRKRWRYDKRHYDDWTKDFETLEEAMKCFRMYFDEAIKSKSRELELSLIIHYGGYKYGMYDRRPHDFVISMLQVDFSTVWEYYHNSGFRFDCYFYPIFDSPIAKDMLMEQTDYKNFAYQIFKDVRKLQGLHLDTERWSQMG